MKSVLIISITAFLATNNISYSQNESGTNAFGEKTRFGTNNTIDESRMKSYRNYHKENKKLLEELITLHAENKILAKKVFATRCEVDRNMLSYRDEFTDMMKNPFSPESYDELQSFVDRFCN